MNVMKKQFGSKKKDEMIEYWESEIEYDKYWEETHSFTSQNLLRLSYGLTTYIYSNYTVGGTSEILHRGCIKSIIIYIKL